MTSSTPRSMTKSLVMRTIGNSGQHRRQNRRSFSRNQLRPRACPCRFGMQRSVREQDRTDRSRLHLRYESVVGLVAQKPSPRKARAVNWRTAASVVNDQCFKRLFESRCMLQDIGHWVGFGSQFAHRRQRLRFFARERVKARIDCERRSSASRRFFKINQRRRAAGRRHKTIARPRRGSICRTLSS